MPKLTRQQKKKQQLRNKALRYEKQKNEHIKKTYGTESTNSVHGDDSGSGVILNKYIELMWEIKRREQVIRCIFKDKCNLLYPIVILEVIFFQLRKILEIIAMSPMLVNEKEYREESKKPDFDWRLSQIVKNLNTANPDYYPKPIMIKTQPNGIDTFLPVKSGFLTVDELLEAYDHCSDFLHSKNPLKKDKDKNFDNELKIHVLRTWF